MTDLVVRSLAECEEVIERGMHTFVEVGRALAEIRTAKLYKDSHATFEDYCQDRWGMTSRHARNLVAAADVHYQIGTTVPIPNERVARELVPLADEPEELQKVWEEVTKQHGDRPTAQQVKEVRVKREASLGDSKVDQELCSKCGRPLPAHMRALNKRGSR